MVGEVFLVGIEKLDGGLSDVLKGSRRVMTRRSDDMSRLCKYLYLFHHKIEANNTQGPVISDVPSSKRLP